jgi:hypothetical protein
LSLKYSPKSGEEEIEHPRMKSLSATSPDTAAAAVVAEYPILSPIALDCRSSKKKRLNRT